jgi:hypothetical protein
MKCNGEYDEKSRGKFVNDKFDFDCVAKEETVFVSSLAFIVF